MHPLQRREGVLLGQNGPQCRQCVRSRRWLRQCSAARRCPGSRVPGCPAAGERAGDDVDGVTGLRRQGREPEVARLRRGGELLELVPNHLDRRRADREHRAKGAGRDVKPGGLDRSVERRFGDRIHRDRGRAFELMLRRGNAGGRYRPLSLGLEA